MSRGSEVSRWRACLNGDMNQHGQTLPLRTSESVITS